MNPPERIFVKENVTDSPKEFKEDPPYASLSLSSEDPADQTADPLSLDHEEDPRNSSPTAGREKTDDSSITKGVEGGDEAVDDTEQDPLIEEASFGQAGCASSAAAAPETKAEESTRKRRFPFQDSISFEKTRFKDIIGHGAVKLRIDEVLLPLALPASVADSVLTGVRALPASILLYGPPGCGKTQLARAIAGEARAAFISIAPSDILSKFVGESEASVRDVFKKAWECASELESKCAVIFFDEIDALGQSRSDRGSGEGEGCSRRVLAELLMQFNAISDQRGRRLGRDTSTGDDCSTHFTSCSVAESEHCRVVVVAATNRPEDCDAALIRRFGIRLHIGPPSKRDRKRMLLHHLSDIEHTLSKEDMNNLATAMEGWSGSDIESMTREAAMAPVRECLREAALWRKRAAKRQQCGGDVSGQQESPMQPPDPDLEAQNLLLTGFQELRPVTIQDFENAGNFWLGNDQQNTTFTAISGVKSHGTHYDSSSSDDD